MSAPVLVIFGSGPGIDIYVAQAFTRKYFASVVLCARNESRLEAEKFTLEETARQEGRIVLVTTFVMDLREPESLKTTFEQIEKIGPLGCVYHNAARLQETIVLSTPAEDVLDEYKIGVLSLYVIAQWAVPLLRHGGAQSPSFYHTNSHFPEQPRPPRFSLAIVKAGQQNLFLTLHQVYGKEVHFGIIKVSGLVELKKRTLKPSVIADRIVQFYERQKEN